MSEPPKLTAEQRKYVDAVLGSVDDALGRFDGHIRAALARLDWLEALAADILPRFADLCVDDALLARARAEGRREGVALACEACAAMAETLYAASPYHPDTNLVVQGLAEHRNAGRAIAGVIRAHADEATG